MNKYNDFVKKLEKFNNSKTEKQERGRIFEKLINDVFLDEGTLIKRSYFSMDNRSEQIDGAIRIANRILLFEVKWVESNMAASELYSFIGKVDNKFAGTLGVFISKEELSDNFLNALNKGRRQTVIPIHGDDLKDFFSSNEKLSDFIEYALENLSLHSIPHISFASFISNKKILTQKQNDKTKDIFSLIFSSSDNSIKILDNISNQNNETDKFFTSYINNYQKIIWATYDKKEYSYAKRNLKFFLENYFDLSSTKVNLCTNFLDNYLKLKKHNLRFSYPSQLIKSVSDYYPKLSPEYRKDFEVRLVETFKKQLGDYEPENILSELIKEIYNSLSDETKIELIQIYTTIFVSSRQDKFEQKSFANDLMWSKNKLIKSGIKKWIKTKYEERKNYNRLLNTGNHESIITNMSIDYFNIARAIGINDLNDWQKFIVESTK